MVCDGAHLSQDSAGAVAWPIVVRAQQAAMPVVGFLHPAASPDAGADRLRGFRQGLKDSGYVEGENVTIVYRWARVNSIGCQRWQANWMTEGSP
jgi:hypothetical protein